MLNTNLNKAKKAKCDEFYTQYADIEKELQYYNIEGKTIYCNCDNPHYSNFYKYFKDKFNTHKIKYLYCTGYNKEGNGYYAEYNGTEETIKTLNGNGDFQSEESIEILNKSDVVITNPPFSLFRPYVKLLMDYNKKFLIIGNQNALTYKEIFPYIKNNELWLGMNWIKDFVQPNGEVKKFGNICWYTNITFINTKQPLILTKTYNPTDYPHYDNYEAINVDKVKDIPIDYDGVMGVPITFLDKYCPSQFEIIKFRKGNDDKDLSVNGKCPYFRILIKKNDSLEQVEFEIVGCADADILPNGWNGMSENFITTYYNQGNTGSYKEGNRLACYIHNGKAKVPFKRILIKRK